MAITVGEGHSRILTNRHYDDYASMKQHFKHARKIQEVIISGSCTSDGALTEISFADNIINYIGAEGQIYIRTEADDGNQDSKYVYVEYQDDTGAIATIVTGDLAAPDNTVEVILTGADDFYRLRQMTSEVESASGGGKSILLCDSDWDGVADTYGEIKDGHSSFALERFFTQPSATCASYLGRVKLVATVQDGDGAVAGALASVTYTPKVIDLGEAQVAADITENFQFDHTLVWEPLYELAPATEVIFKIGDLDSPHIIHIEATMLEVYDSGYAL